MRDLGYEPIFVPFIKRNLTNSNEEDADSTSECDKQTKINMDQLKVVHNKLKTAKKEEAILLEFYKSNFINKDEWMELQREFKNRYTVLNEDKVSVLKKVQDNIQKGYGHLEGTLDHGLKDNYPTSSKVLEALNSKNVRENLFPQIHGDAPNSSKIIETLKNSGILKEDTFSANTE